VRLAEINRAKARIEVSVNYPAESHPFATFRSMFVANGNADVDHVRWTDTSGGLHDDPIMAFAGGEGGQWLFQRSTRSQQNTSAPDILIRPN
jgi:hypothetical protein